MCSSDLEVWYDWFSDTRGRWVEKNDYFLFNLDLQSGDLVRFTVNPIWERLPEPFHIAPGITLPFGQEYDYLRYLLSFDTAEKRPVAFSGNVSLGTFYSGHRRDLRGTITVRPRRGLLAQITTEFNDVDLAEGRFSTKLFRGLINTQFSPFVSVSNNIQYDSVTQIGRAHVLNSSH